MIYRKFAEKSRCLMKGIIPQGKPCTRRIRSFGAHAPSAAELRGIDPFDAMPRSVMRKQAFAQRSLRQTIKNFFRALKSCCGKAKKWEIRKIDIFLMASLAVLSIVFLLLNFTFKKAFQPKWTELRLSRQWETVFGSETMSELIAEFEERNPQLRIKFTELTESAETPETNNAANASTSLPDILLMDDSRLSRSIRKEALLPLIPYNPDNSGQWAIPLVLSMDILFYNIDALKAVGFDRPPKTREEFLKYTRAVSEKSNGVYGAAPGLSADDRRAIQREVFSWLWAAGFPVIKDDEPRFDKKAMTDLIAFLSQINDAVQSDANVFDKTGAQRLEEFARGRLAMIIAPAQDISVLRKMPVNFEFGVTVIPGGAAPGKINLGLSGFYAGISGECAHPDEARLFLSFIEEKSPGLTAKTGAVPGLLHGLPPGEGAAGAYLNEDPLYAKTWDIFESSLIAETFSGHPLADDLEQTVRDELHNCFSGKIRPTEAAEAIQKRWELIIKN